jgi:hypothetical protein
VAAVNFTAGDWSGAAVNTPFPSISMSVLSGSPSGDGSTASPYLVAANTSPSPVYRANVPGLLTVNFTNTRTYNCDCGKSGCNTCRYNEAVYITDPRGSYLERIRTNSRASFGYGGSEQSYASQNTKTTIKCGVYAGQLIRMSSGPPRGFNQYYDGNTQLDNARISYTPSDENFHLVYEGSQPMLGDGSPSNPYRMQSPGYSVGANTRTLSFRAVGKGVVVMMDPDPEFLSTSYTFISRHIFKGGTPDSFSGGSFLSGPDQDSIINPDTAIGRLPTNYKGVIKTLWLEDGERFSFAYNNGYCDKGGCYSWLEERRDSTRGWFVMVAPKSTDTPWLINYRPGISSPDRYQRTASMWTGLGTPASPASMINMDRFSNIFFPLDGSITFDYEVSAAQWDCGKNGCSSTYHVFMSDNFHTPFSAGGISGFDGLNFKSVRTFNGLSSLTGSITMDVKALNRYTFGATADGPNLKITNLVFTPS